MAQPTPHRDRMPLLSVQEAATYLGCSRDHVYDLIDKGHLRAVNIAIVGSRMRIHPEELDEYVQRRTGRVDRRPDPRL